MILWAPSVTFMVQSYFLKKIDFLYQTPNKKHIKTTSVPEKKSLDMVMFAILRPFGEGGVFQLSKNRQNHQFWGEFRPKACSEAGSEPEGEFRGGGVQTSFEAQGVVRRGPPKKGRGYPLGEGGGPGGPKK